MECSKSSLVTTL